MKANDVNDPFSRNTQLVFHDAGQTRLQGWGR